MSLTEPGRYSDIGLLVSHSVAHVPLLTDWLTDSADNIRDANYEIEQLRAEISQLEADVREAHGAARTSDLRQAMLQVHCVCELSSAL